MSSLDQDRCHADVRMLPREFVRKFIETYKSYPCLWKVRHPAYNNRTMRDEAYKQMAEFCRKMGYTEANRDFVAKKIQSLRGSFRKETRKCRKFGTEAQLWYYDLLTFTLHQDEGAHEQSNNREDKYFEHDDEENEENDTAVSNNSNSNLVFLTNDEDDGDRDDEALFEADDDKFEELEDTPSEPETRSRKRHRPTKSTQEELPTHNTRHTNKSISEFEAVGVNVTRKLERMDPKQAIYAESIINAVLKRGLLKKLKEADACDGECRFFSSVPMPVVNPLDVGGLKRE